MPAGCRITSCHSLIAPPSCRLVAPAGCCIASRRPLICAALLSSCRTSCCIASRRPLVVPPSCQLVMPAYCCIASPCPLVATRDALLSSCPTGLLCRLSTCRPLVVLSSHHAASRCLVAPAGCRAIISCRPLVAPPSRPLIVLAGFCIACPCTSLSSSHCSPLPMPSKAIKCCCCHQTPPPPPPLNAVSIVHRCYSCRPSSPSNANTHLRSLPLSNPDARHCRLPQLMSIFIIALSSPIRSPHCRCH